MKIQDRNPTVGWVITILLEIFFCPQIIMPAKPVLENILFIITLFSLIAYMGAFLTQYCVVEEKGLTVVRYGCFKHVIPWEKMQYAEVYALVSRTYRPWIVCAPKGWPFRLDVADLMILKPFSMCVFHYSPERAEELEKHGISVRYRTPYGKVMQMYEETQSKYW